MTAASYGADGASYAETGKSTSDHFMSMVSKKDCALWRVFRNENVCHARPDGKDPYHVDYDTAERMPSEDGVSYAPPLRQTPDEPASSWTAEAYARNPGPVPATPSEPVVAAIDPASAPPPVEEKPVPTHKPVKKKVKAPVRGHAHLSAVAHAKPIRKASPNQVASVP
ncbi:MAG: hypothetical protein JSS04_08660 [Proteobacteria bacterium]|nr:hypothetical protein [Pseudomonadota bacterium]